MRTKRSVFVIGLGLAGVACSGGGGAQGSESGNAATLIDVRDEAAGANCPSGGMAILTGQDVDGDGVLDPEEVHSMQYVCGASTSGGGAAGASLVASTTIASGDETCPLGGVLISSGIDADGDGMLGASEVADQTKVCNGGVAAASACVFPGVLDVTDGKCDRSSQWADASLAGADLSSTYLAGIDLSGADLSGAALRYSELRGANLEGANLSGADLVWRKSVWGDAGHGRAPRRCQSQQREPLGCHLSEWHAA